MDLLILKDKVRVDVPFNNFGKVEVIDVEGEVSEGLKHTGLDPMGIFKVRVNHEDGVIEALYVGRKGRILLRGRSAKSIMSYVLSKGLISRLSHAAYLGAELAKAEEALRIGKNYVQEEPLFRERRYLRLRKRR